MNTFIKDVLHKYITLLSISALLIASIAAIGIRTASALPPDFQISDVSTDFTIPSGLEVLPDGRIFVTELTGEVKIYENGQVLPQPFITIPTDATVDRGLLGIAADPAFGSSPYVYFYYTDVNDFQTVARVNASTNVGGPLEILYQVPEFSPGQHVGGTLRFGGDGKLYVSIGDNQTPTNSQDTSNVFGSVIRLNKDGSIPTDNPFIGQSGVAQELYAYGFRNPFRMHADPASGNIYVGDVGQGTWEEVNLLQAGGNYGWPTHEGACTCAGFVDPVYQYPHVGGVGSITMGPVYRGGNFPAQYDGDIFISDFSLGFLRHLDMNASGTAVLGETEFETNLGSVVDVKQAPDGSLYMVTIFPGKLMRLTYDTNNSLPVVSASADVTSGSAPLTVNFSSVGTSDADGDDLDYLWDFGDGTTSTDENPTKVYNNSGQYNAKLTVSDGTGSVTSPNILIQVGTAPTVTILSPTEGDTYHAGDTFNYTVTATDSNGVQIPAADVVSRTILHHDDHTHPHVGPFVGYSGSFTIATTGESSTNTWYELITTATDSNGLQSETSVNVYPVVTNFTADTSPSGFEVLINGTPYTAPKNVDSVVGFERELSVSELQFIGTQAYEFVSWSDGVTDATRLFTTPVSPTTITAQYQPTATPDSFFAEYYNNETLTGPPAFTQFEDTINYHWPTGVGPNVGGLQDDHFSIRWTKTATYAADDYDMSVTADDGVRLYLDGNLLIDEWHLQGPTTYTTTQALDGQHEIVIEYYEHEIDATIAFNMSGEPGGGGNPGGDPGQNGEFNAKYWNLPNPTQYLVAPPTVPSTTPDYTETTTLVDYFWGAGSPVPGTINEDRFVATWETEDTFAAGDYEFMATSDDGVRVYFDGALIIDEWNDHGPTTFSADVLDVAAGDHTILIEYYENGFDAVMQFGYQQTGGGGPGGDPTPEDDTTPNDGLYTTRYWQLNPGGGFPPDFSVLGDADLETTDSEINHIWDTSGPLTIGDDNFAAQWVKTDQYAAGTYDFSTFTDDGVRLYVDDVLVIDQWVDQGPTWVTAPPIDLTAGEHTVRMEYYEHAGGAVAILDTQFTPDGGGGDPGGGNDESTVTVYAYGYTGEENIELEINGQTVANFDSISTTLTPYEYTTTDPLTITQLRVNFTNDFYAPPIDRNVLIDRVEIDGVVFESEDPANPALGHYTAANGCGVGFHSTEILYCSGWIEYVHAVGVELASDGNGGGNNGGGGDDHEDHDHPYDVKYWNLPNPGQVLSNPPAMPTGAPDYEAQAQTISHFWFAASPVPGVINTDRFVGQWGKHQHLDGDYRFTVTSDDGVRVFLDNTLIIDEWNDHGSTTYTVDLTGLSGTYDIVVQYYENGWDAVLEFDFEELL